MDALWRFLLLVATTWWLVGSLIIGTAAMTNQDAYPGLRRPPSAKISAAAASSSNSYDENYLSQILNFIEEQARRKFKENLRKSYQPKQNDDENPEEIEDALNRIFTFKMPELKGDSPAIDEPFDFGVAPNDPRFYNKNPSNQMDREQLEEEEEEAARYRNSMDGLEKNSNEGPYMRIKGPLIVNPKPNPDSFYKSKDMQGLLHKWGRNNNNNAVPGGFDTRLPPGAPSLVYGQEVVQRPVNEQAPVSVYAVALIAGVSAAITIGLIALGVGWWTFYKKSKAAQDVEYPAYGITGPNKEKLSPSSGDRRLAQNAQMYHYQHQKQQIIAMENKMNEDRNGSLSDAANSEDEEGDYTVYECPGLGAHTGEMEVKNPLFFDDPTPATPAGATQKAATAPEPPAAEEGQGKKTTSSTAAAGHKKSQKK